MITRDTYLERISAHVNTLGKVAVNAFEKPIPACPGWTMADLMWHMGEVLVFWKQVIDKRALDTSELKWIERPKNTDLVSWYTDGVTSAIETLTTADPAMPCWTWTGTQNVDWIIRRMAHETAVHVWDACNAAGVSAPLDAQVASDGIDEFLYVMLPHQREGQPVVGGSVHLHCTDVEGEWLVVPSEGTDMSVTREHAKGSVALRGSSTDLFLLLWRRIPSFAVEVIGDAAVAERFLLRTALD